MPGGEVVLIAYDAAGIPRRVRVDTLGRLSGDAGSGSYNTPTNGAVPVAAGAVATDILAANPNRLYALMVNHSAVVIFLALGADAVVNSAIYLAPTGGAYEMSPQIGNLFLGRVSAIHAGVGAQIVGTVEGV